MTIQDHISHIQAIVNSGVPSDDKKFADEHIYHLMKINRGRLLYDKQNKNYKLSTFNFQYLECFPLEEGYLNDCPGIPQDCKVLVSKKKLPKIISWRNGLILKVMNLRGRTIPQTDLSRSNYSKFRKTKTSRYSWFIHNDRLVVTGDLRLCVIALKFIAEDPLDLANYNVCDESGEDTGIPCFDPMVDNFPLDIELVDPMYKLIFQDLQFGMQLPNDNENNAKSVEAVQGKE